MVVYVVEESANGYILGVFESQNSAYEFVLDDMKDYLHGDGADFQESKIVKKLCDINKENDTVFIDYIDNDYNIEYTIYETNFFKKDLTK